MERIRHLGLICVAFLFLSGCQKAVPQTPDPVQVATRAAATLAALAPTELPADEITETETASPAKAVSLDATYQDPDLGFSFDYPVNWELGYQEQQSRGRFFQFVGPDGDQENIKAQITILNWDPKQDLDAFLEVRRTAWDSSGIEMLEETSWVWGEGFPGRTFFLQGMDGADSQVHLTYVGDRYLEFSTSSEMDVLSAVVNTLR